MNELANINNNLTKLSDLIKIIEESDDIQLQDNVRRFKLMLVKKSLVDVITMIDMSDLVKTELMKKVQEDITIYPVTTLIDIMSSINDIIDRNLKVVESLFKSDDLLSYIEGTRQVNVFQVNNNSQEVTPAMLEKISRVVEDVISRINNTVGDS